MHIVITGGTGFIGRAVVAAALARGHAVTVLTRDAKKAKQIFPDRVAIHSFSRLEDIDAGAFNGARLIHLAWSDVGKYTEPKNLFDNLEPHFIFLSKMIQAGITHLTIAGSCLEYGRLEGALKESAAVQPCTYYGLAKNTLWQMLGLLREKNTHLTLNWLRYFYVYGPGQRPQALLPQLLSAIERGDEVFNMSPGDQSRDFIHIDSVAHNTILAAEQDKELGILNIGSGKPKTVLDVVKAVIAQKGAKIKLNPGFYPYTTYEPFSFWAGIEKLKTLDGVIIDEKIRL